MAAARRLADPPSARKADVPEPRPVLLPFPEPPAPLIDGVESPELWNQHRAALLADLQPHSAVEQMLADQITVLSWRLRRVQRHETETLNQARAMAYDDVACFVAGIAKPEARADVLATARVRRHCAAIDTLDAQIARLDERIEQHLQEEDWTARLFELPDDQVLPGEWALYVFNLAADAVEARTGAAPEGPCTAAFLAALGVKGFHGEDAYTGPFPARWTAGRVRAGVERLFGGPVEIWPAIAALSAAAAVSVLEPLGAEREQAKARREEERTGIAEEVVRLRRQRTLAEPKVLKEICQAEGHLERSLHRAMGELRRWQALRAKRPAAPVVAEGLSVVAEVSVPLQAFTPEETPGAIEEPREERVVEAVAESPAVELAPAEAPSIPAAPVAEPPAAPSSPEMPRVRHGAAPVGAPAAEAPVSLPRRPSTRSSAPGTARPAVASADGWFQLRGPAADWLRGGLEASPLLGGRDAGPPAATQGFCR